MKTKSMVTVGVLVVAVTSVPLILMSKSKEVAQSNPNLNINLDSNPLAKHAKRGLGVLKSSVENGVQPSVSITSVGGGGSGGGGGGGSSSPKTSNSKNCDTNYSGCVPLSTTVTCGNHVPEPVKVLITDIHNLDADKDGWGCRSSLDKSKSALVQNAQEIMDCFGTYCLTGDSSPDLSVPDGQ